MLQTEQVSNLAVFGGGKTVTEAMPRWPYFSDAEIEEANQVMVQAREGLPDACSAPGGGIGEKLEQRFAEYIGRQFALGTNGCGPALHIACMAAGVKLGDEVITTPYSWGQTCSCILQAGGVPVFADIDPERLTLDPASIESKITSETKAVVLSHIYGMPADMNRIMDTAERYNLTVIEDCAQAHGSVYNNEFVGSHAHMSCFSLGSTKNIAAGEAGMLVTDDRDLYERCLLAGMHPGRLNKEIQDPELKEYVDSLIYTYRINTLSAAIAYRQLDRLEDMNEWRRKNAADLMEAAENMPGIRPQKLPEDSRPAWHMIPWTFVPEEVPGATRAQYIAALKAEGVPLNGSYVGTPIHLRKVFREKSWWLGKGYPWQAHPKGDDIVYEQGQCPVAEERCSVLDLNMPGSPLYTDCSELINQVSEAFEKVASQIERVREVEV